MRRGSNIRQRADGRFEARYAKGRDKQGRIIYGCCYGRTYEEAAQKREETVLKAAPIRELNLLILGAGSHGHEVQELAQSLNVFRTVAFLDDVQPEAVGPIRDMARYVDAYPVAIPAVGDPALRSRWFLELTAAGFILPVLIHPSAAVSPSAEIGAGTVVCARATVGLGARIGKGCIIASGATIGRYAELSDGCHIDCGQVVAAAARMAAEGST